MTPADAASLLRAGRVEEAVRLLRRLAALAPDTPGPALQLGAALLQGQDSAAALAHFQAVTRSWPGLEDGWQGLGKALVDLHRPDAAVAAFTEAARRSPAPARALYHRGMAHLLAGRFAEGWAEYEQRLHVPELRPRLLPAPLWDGSALAGRRLLVVCEQGYGDMFQVIRLLPRLHALGGRILFECPEELRMLLAPLLQGCDVVPLRGREPPQAGFDLWLPLMSLPHRLGLTLADLPGPMPYLHADPLPQPPGALGRPAIVLLHHAAEWRWLIGRDASPWYPSMRLARQPAPGNWEGAVAAVLAGMEPLLSGLLPAYASVR